MRRRYLVLAGLLIFFGAMTGTDTLPGATFWLGVYWGVALR